MASRTRLQFGSKAVSNVFLRRDGFTHRDAFTHRTFTCRAFTQGNFYTEKPLHRAAFTHGNFYTQHFYTKRLLHTEVFTCRNFCIEKVSHTHTCFYTTTLLHRDTFSHRVAFTPSKIAIFTKIVYVRKRLGLQFQYRNFTSVFGLQP